MPFVSRNRSGEITGFSDKSLPGFEEEMLSWAPEFVQFLVDRVPAGPEAAREVLAATDMQMLRLIEDLVELLITKQLIKFTDLPPAAAEKYIKRQIARLGLQNASPIVEEHDVL